MRGSGKRGGFVLFEVMLAVTIFVLGVLALGRCVENILSADNLKQDDERARQALSNAMAMIEAGAVAGTDSSRDDLKGMFAGMALKTSRQALKEKNENNQEIFGVYLIKLEVTWTQRGEKQSRELSFYHYPRQR